MKKLLILLSVVPILTTSCGQQNNQNTMSEFSEDAVVEYRELEIQSDKQSAKNSNAQVLKDFQIMSPDFGIPVGTMRIPVSWKESYNTKESLLLEGADGIKIYKARYTSHFYSNDPYRNQIAMQNGESVQPVKGIESVINDVLKPIGQAEGVHLVRQTPLPQMAQFDTRFESYLFQATPAQKQHQCLITEWEDQQGNPSMVIIRYFVTYYQIGGMGWGYTLNAIDASKENYEETKNAYINALVNFQINPQWVQKNNEYWSQVAHQSNVGHQSRMNGIKAFGDAAIKAGEIRSEASDINHSKFIDHLRDETNVTNPVGTGQTYKVESGSKYYWMNSNGEYIKSDDPFYNPNTDPTYNNQTWTKTNIDK